MSFTTETEPTKWQAVYNEILFEFQRKDYLIQSIDSYKFIYFTDVTGITVGDNIFLKSDVDEMFAEVVQVSPGGNCIKVDKTIIAQAGVGGFVNDNLYNEVEKYYALGIIVNDILYKKVQPDIRGLVSVDLHDNLVSILSATNTDTYTTKYREDENLCKKYTVKVYEIWCNTVETAIEIGSYFTLFAAANYSDMVNYAIKPNNFPNTFYAKFLTEFDELIYYNNQDFDLCILMDLDNNDLLIKEDVHYKNGSSAIFTYNLDNHYEKMIRLSLQGNYTDVNYIDLYLWHVLVPPEMGSYNRLTEKKRIWIKSEPCNEKTACWINLLGGLDYWLFQYKQIEKLNVKTSVIEFEAIEFDYKKEARDSVLCYADNIEIKHKAALKSLLFGLQHWVDRTRVVIKAKSYNLYDTSSSRFSIVCEFVYKKMNLGNL